MAERSDATEPVSVSHSQWPRLSVIVPARNEADSLPITLPSWLSQDYPDSEIIVIDDESLDHTAGGAKEIARRFDRNVRVLARNHTTAWLDRASYGHFSRASALHLERGCCLLMQIFFIIHISGED